MYDNKIQEQSMTTQNPPPNALTESHTLWMGDIESWMDEAYIAKAFSQLGYGSVLASVKIIRDKTEQTVGYGFVEFNTREAAQHILITLNGAQIPGTSKRFKLNEAVYGGGVKAADTSASKAQQEISIYVGGLDFSITGPTLMEFYKAKYPSVYSSKVITDPGTKFSKGYGFVLFHSNEEAQKALVETNGLLLAGKMIKVSNAFSKTSTDPQQTAQQPPAPVQMPQQIETQNLTISQKQQLYEYYMSLINDPAMKVEYERQLQVLYGIDPKNAKKKTLRSEMEGLPILEYNDTTESEKYLGSLNKMEVYRGRTSILDLIFH